MEFGKARFDLTMYQEEMMHLKRGDRNFRLSLVEGNSAEELYFPSYDRFPDIDIFPDKGSSIRVEMGAFAGSGISWLKVVDVVRRPMRLPLVRADYSPVRASSFGLFS